VQSECRTEVKCKPRLESEKNLYGEKTSGPNWKGLEIYLW
jgi:hypothetical protein